MSCQDASSAIPRARTVSRSNRRRPSYLGLVHGSSAPAASERFGSGTINDSSYSSTAPKPLQLGHAPRGLLKEKSVGVSTGAAQPHAEQAGCSEKRRRSPLLSASATPSPSLNAVATASASRLRFSSAAAIRSTITSTS